jgi:hypothetical protein
VPEWEAAKREHPEVRFVATSVVADEAIVRRWADQHGLTPPIAVTTGNLLTALGVDGVPAMALLDDGRVVAVARDGADAEDIDAVLATSLRTVRP